jgi:hypothetical protein|tara:strand:+ start:2918 stop:3076 length:159 start_codon:yes stop_codon:yes gene_type:complete
MKIGDLVWDTTDNRVYIVLETSNTGFADVKVGPGPWGDFWVDERLLKLLSEA